MKSTSLFPNERMRWLGSALLGLWLAATTLSAAETNAPSETAPVASTNAPSSAATNAPKATVAPPLTPEQFFEGGATTYNNWIDLSAGGFITKGNKSEFQQWNQTSGGAFGGIEDLHFQTNIAKGTTLTADGRAIFDNHDYKLNLAIDREKLGYLRFSGTQYRTWYDGDGGFFPPTGAYYSHPGDAVGLDRGDFSVEAGLRLDKVPKLTFKYDHTYRDGEKGSTIWGQTHPGAGVGVRGLSPSIYNIDERSDIFQFDVAHQIKKVDVGAGVRYETGRMDDQLRIDQFPGESTQQKITDRQGTSYDFLNVHSFAESWVHKNVMLSSGFAFSDLDNDFSGSRNYGSEYDVGYAPNAQNGFGYYGLHGGSRLYEYVGNVNLFTRPWQHFTIVPSVRVQQHNTDASSSGTETLSNFQPTSFGANSDLNDLDVRERLDLTYNGVTNWVFYGRGELTEGNGTLAESGGIVPINGIGIPGIDRNTDIDRLLQKYSAGARWYPARRLTLDVGGYYKRNEYNYDSSVDNTPNDSSSPNRYPAYLTLQNFQTYDGNARVTFRPRQNVTAVVRYDYQYSTVHTQPDEVSGLNEVESSRTLSHIIGQDLSWTPWSRLYLQAGLNYILNETKTPGLDSPAVLPAQNDYWTVNASSGLVLDDKTDLNLGFFYYRADDYVNNSLEGVPYGAGATEYTISATLTRRITQNIRWSLKYAYSQYNDQTYGGHRDFDAHLIYSSLQYRF